MPLRILYLGLLAALCAAAGLSAGEPTDDAGPAATLRTREGSLLSGILISSELVFEKDDGSTERLAWKDVASIELAERIDAKDAEAARSAVTELASDNYQIRQKAQQRLAALGRGAAPALRAGAKSKDPEVAIRARELLVKLGTASDGASGDRITGTNRTPREGTVTADSYELRTARGTIVLPAESVDGLSVLNAKDAAALLAATKHWPAPGAKKIVGLVESSVVDLDGVEIGFKADLAEVLNMPARMLRGTGLTLVRVDAMRVNDKQVEEGDRLETTFRSQGLLLQAANPLHAAKSAVGRDLNGLGVQEKGEADSKGIEIVFAPLDGNTIAPAGVLEFSAAIEFKGAERIVVTAYNVRGHLTGRKVLSLPEDTQPALAQWISLRSRVPIGRVNVCPEPNNPGAVILDEMLFSRILAFDHDTRLDALTLASGERFVGKLETVGEGKDRIAIRPAFLPKDAPSIRVDVKDVVTVVPALSEAASKSKEDDTAEPLDEAPAPAPAPIETPRERPFIPHGILLQNGDRLLARLLKLDSESAVLELPGRVELKLPRAALRKVDLRPGMPVAPPTAAGDGEGEGEAKAEGDAKAEGGKQAADAPPADPLDPDHVKKEKTGVEFAQRTASAAGKTSTEGMPRMDNAEILSIDARKNALTVDPKDGGPPWPIDLHSARFLVFPEAPAPAAGNAGGWVLTLRIGSRFAFELQGLDANGVRGKLAGGEVAMPWSAIESLVRNRPEKK